VGNFWEMGKSAKAFGGPGNFDAKSAFQTASGFQLPKFLPVNCRLRNSVFEQIETHRLMRLCSFNPLKVAFCLKRTWCDVLTLRPLPTSSLA
jgi:hypothetical protein